MQIGAVFFVCDLGELRDVLRLCEASREGERCRCHKPEAHHTFRFGIASLPLDLAFRPASVNRVDTHKKHHAHGDYRDPQLRHFWLPMHQRHV